MIKASVYCDGGYDNATKKSDGYGSFVVLVNDNIVKDKRFLLPDATSNNEAEYLSLLEVFSYIDKIESKGKKVEWIIFMDSRLVVEQSNGRWRIKANNLRDMNQRAKTFINDHPNVILKWVRREEIFEILGH